MSQVSAWSGWGACTGGRRGRHRVVLRYASGAGKPCPRLHQYVNCEASLPVDCKVRAGAAAHARSVACVRVGPLRTAV